MKNYRLYIISALAWIALAFIATACSHNDSSGGSGSSSTCVSVNGVCSVSGTYGGTFTTPPYPAMYNTTITDTTNFYSLNIRLNGSASSVWCGGYGASPITVYNTQGSLTSLAETCNQLQVAFYLQDSSHAIIYLVSPSIIANDQLAYQNTQNTFTAMNPYNAFAEPTYTWGANPAAQIGSQVGAGYTGIVTSIVYNGPYQEQLPVMELDIIGSTANLTMLFGLKYLSGANQTLIATGLMRKGIDYQ